MDETTTLYLGGVAVDAIQTTEQFVAVLGVVLITFAVCVLICMASMFVEEYRNKKRGF
jgi:hypothetical protein